MVESGTETPGGRAYRIRRSERARRSRLTLGRDGELVVVLPRGVPIEEASRLLVEHRAWIDRHIARLGDVNARLRGRPRLGEGRVLVVAGESRRVSAVDAGAVRPARGRVDLDGTGLIVRLGRDGRDTRELLEGWLREEARWVISARVAIRSAEMGVRPGRLSIRDQCSRWGSASARGALSFSWRLILAPPFVLDAVVVHELAHLRVRGHSRAFWSLVERHAPRTVEARRWLREHEPEVRAALDDGVPS